MLSNTLTNALPAKIATGSSVLLVGNAAASAEALQSAHGSLQQRVQDSGRVVFEQLDRVPHISLAPAGFAAVVSGAAAPAGASHTAAALAQFARSLAARGVLLLRELVVADLAASEALDLLKSQSQSQSLVSVPSLRTERALLADLTVCGFVDSVVSERVQVPDSDLLTWASATWHLSSQDAASVVALLSGITSLVTIQASKPDYELGAAAPLKFAKKKTPAAAKGTRLLSCSPL
eukprot:jgi/Hompol1/1458/HPOL_004620-RA